ncbi:MAG: ATP-binding protein [Mycobacteriales bacterium]
MAAEPPAGSAAPGTEIGRPRRRRSVTRWWGRLSLRARLTTTATAVLCIGLLVAGVALIWALNRSLTGALDSSARRTAAQIAALVESGDALPNPLPVGDGNTVLVQVVNPRGQVLGASATQSQDRLVSLLTSRQLREVRGGDVLTLSGDLVAVNGPVRVVGRATGLGNADETVVVAVYADQVGRSERAVRNGLLIGAPVLLILGGLLAWYVVGRTLRPVESLRAGAAAISGTRPSGTARRLPVPAGEDEIHRLAATLNDMLARLDAASARQRGFIADAAHELRSPLASLRTQLEVAQHVGPRADWSSTADGALVDIDRLTRLVDDLLLLARLDEAGARRHRERTDLGALVSEVAASYPADTPLWVSAPGAVTVDADPDALARIVRNLVDNAVRHARSRVDIAVTASGVPGRAPDVATLSITDDGPGIAAADRERVFDRFARLDEARARDSGGTGLGLPIVRELIRSHGGTLRIADAVPGADYPGLRVQVRLPVAERSS